MVEVYSNLDGFPTQNEQPGYYEMLANIGSFAEQKDTKVLVAVSAQREIFGGVVNFGDMARYGSGGTATAEKNASGIRLLGVDRRSRGTGVGKALTNACISNTHFVAGTMPPIHMAILAEFHKSACG